MIIELFNKIYNYLYNIDNEINSNEDIEYILYNDQEYNLYYDEDTIFGYHLILAL